MKGRDNEASSANEEIKLILIMNGFGKDFKKLMNYKKKKQN